MSKPPFKLNGDESDAFSRRAKKVLKWKPGERKQIKKLFNRKVRRLKNERKHNILCEDT